LGRNFNLTSSDKALTATGSLTSTGEKAASLSGYMTVWAVCSGAAILAAVALMAAPAHAFSDKPIHDVVR